MNMEQILGVTIALGSLGWIAAFIAVMRVAAISGEREALQVSGRTSDEEVRRLMDVIKSEVERSVLLISQHQNMAQRLATLQVKEGAVPMENTFEHVEPPKPYSEGIQNFLARLESSEAVRLVEEEIEFHRALNKSDEDILQIIRS